jgi:hypothetical protein
MKYFSLIDLKDGFFHIPIKKEDREKTTFYTGKKLMQFIRMAQGFKNSPAIFQRAMNLIFGDLMRRCCIVYIDDILVFGKTKNEHDKNLGEVEKIIEKYALKENKNKRITQAESIRFLGYEISMNTLKPSLDRSQGILKYAKPKNKKNSYRGFLG